MIQQFDTVISSKRGWFDINIRELIRYRDLIIMFVKRNFIADYKQTILGPSWAVIQPLLTTVVFTIIFGNVAKLPTDNIPPFLFYMCGNVSWGYFAGCLNQTAVTFTSNAHIMGKVYFPRLVMPIAAVMNQMIRFMIQFVLLLGFIIYYSWHHETLYITWYIFYLPLLLLNMAMLGLGCGIIISSLTTKYRDLVMLIGFGVQLWMYATPVVYTLEMIPDRWRSLYLCNPMVVVIEISRGMFFGNIHLTFSNIVFCWGITLLIATIGVLLFNRVEKTFMDTI